MSHYVHPKPHMSDLERVLADIQSEADRRTHIGQMPLARVLDALHAVQKDARQAVNEHGHDVIQLVSDFRGRVAAVTRDNIFPNHVHVAELRQLGIQIESDDDEGFEDVSKSNAERDAWDTAMVGPKDHELRTREGLEKALADLGRIYTGGKMLNLERALRVLAVLSTQGESKAKDMLIPHETIQAVRKYAQYIRLHAGVSEARPAVASAVSAIQSHVVAPIEEPAIVSVQAADAYAGTLPQAEGPQQSAGNQPAPQPPPEPSASKEQVSAAVQPPIIAEPEGSVSVPPAFTIEEPKGNWRKWNDNMIRTFLLRVEEGLQATPKRSIADTCRRYLVLPAQHTAFKKTHGAPGTLQSPAVPKPISPVTDPVAFVPPATEKSLFVWPELPAYGGGWDDPDHAMKKKLLRAAHAFGRGGISEASRHYGIKLSTVNSWKVRIKLGEEMTDDPKPEPESTADDEGEGDTLANRIALFQERAASGQIDNEVDAESDRLEELNILVSELTDIAEEKNDDELRDIVERLRARIAAIQCEVEMQADAVDVSQNADDQDVVEPEKALHITDASPQQKLPDTGEAVALFQLVRQAAVQRDKSEEISPAQQAIDFAQWYTMASGASVPLTFKRALELAEYEYKSLVTHAADRLFRQGDAGWKRCYEAGMKALRLSFTTYIPSRHGHFSRDYALPIVRDAIQRAAGIREVVEQAPQTPKKYVPEGISDEEQTRRTHCVEWAKPQTRNVQNYTAYVNWIMKSEMRWVYELVERLLEREAGDSTATKPQLSNIGYHMLRNAIDVYDPERRDIEQFRSELSEEMEERMRECIAGPSSFPDPSVKSVSGIAESVSPKAFASKGARGFFSPRVRDPDESTCARFREWALHQGASGTTYRELLQSFAELKVPSVLKILATVSIPKDDMSFRQRLIDAAQHALIRLLWNFNPETDDIDELITVHMQAVCRRAMEKLKQ